jgi:hypothetical protein
MDSAGVLVASTFLGGLSMHSRKLLIGSGIFVVVGIGWYLFRPELLFVNSKVNEQFPTAGTASPRTEHIVLRGVFHGVAHEGKGAATIHQLGDGTRVLRLTDFETSNGPALHVYLVATADATDSDTVKKSGTIDLGALKGNIGDQNYEVPPDADLSNYRAVTIWCQRFSVNFATAPLTRAASTASRPEASRM